MKNQLCAKFKPAVGSIVLALAVLTMTALPSHAVLVNFGAGADDYISLTIGGSLLCVYDAFPAGGCNGVFDMTPGVWYDIAIDYKNRFGSDGMSLIWDQPVGSAPHYGFGPTLATLVVPKTHLRTSDGLGGYISGLHAEYYTLGGSLQTIVEGEGPIDHIANIYEGVATGGLFNPSWAGHGYFDLFEEKISGQITLDPSAVVPEPATLLLLGSGLAGLAYWRRRKAA